MNNKIGGMALDLDDEKESLLPSEKDQIKLAKEMKNPYKKRQTKGPFDPEKALEAKMNQPEFHE